jgi:site-specific DNA recombinase
LVVRVTELGKGNTNEKALIEFGFDFLSNLDKLFTSADLEGKRRIIGSTFPEKLVYEKSAYRTAANDNVLLLIANTGKGLEEKKERRLDNSNLLSRGVVAPGIEPGSKV